MTQTNWQELLHGLKARGYTQEEIAKKAGCTQSYISHLKKGKKKECSYRIGEALIKMTKEF